MIHTISRLERDDCHYYDRPENSNKTAYCRDLRALDNDELIRELRYCWDTNCGGYGNALAEARRRGLRS